MPQVRRAKGPGRVNLIGDHTDYNRGLALPMAIGLGVTAEFTHSDEPHILVSSTAFGDTVFTLDRVPDAGAVRSLEPSWLRLIAAMIGVSRPDGGGSLHIDADLPIGAGLSSSAALCVALAEVFGVTGPPTAIARLCQEAEHRTGVPVGAMDPLVCSGARRGHALLIDFSTMSTFQVALPSEAEVVVIDSGQPRDLRGSEYATRVAECAAASAVIGPLGLADGADLAGLADPLLARRARHVITECQRVRLFTAALGALELAGAGRLMTESHRSLADDFAVSTPAVDELVERLVPMDGVFGARMTGAGFGGCVVALSRPGAIDLDSLPTRGWRVEAVDGTVAARGYSGPES